jgi:hypothetical protein
MRKLLISIILTGALSIGIAHAYSPQYGINEGLVGYWTLDARHTPWTSVNDATTIDVSGNGWVGTFGSLNRSTAAVMGRIHEAIYFGSGDGYISFGDFTGLNGKSAMTVAFWFKLDNSMINTGGNYFVSKWGELADQQTFVVIGGGSEILFAIRATNANFQFKSTSGAGIEYGKWYHFVGTFENNNDMRMYINGIEQAIFAGYNDNISTINNTDNSLTIGESPFTNGNSAISGSIDDVRLYDRSITASEVKTLYRHGLGGGSR